MAWHDWTSVKLNLYGARKRTTWFEVSFIKFVDHTSNLFDTTTPSGAKSCQNLIQYWERPLIYSNLQTDVSQNAPRLIKVLRRYKYYVPAASTTDPSTATGRMKEVSIFFRHDKLLNMRHENADANHLSHAQVDGLDYVRSDTLLNVPDDKDRIIMVIKAFCPERLSTATYPGLDLPVDYPSYDILIRNKFTKPY